MPKKKKRRYSISRLEALSRVRVMHDTVERDLRMALWDESVLEAGNEQLHGVKYKSFEGAAAYVVIHQALVANLSITIARPYDSGSARFAVNRRQISSLPLLMRLVKQKRCRDAFIERARHWYGMHRVSAKCANDCADALDAAINTYNLLMRSSGPKTIARVKNFRNYRVAHSQIDDIASGFPFYKDLFLLIERSVTIIESLRLAIDGHNLNLQDIREGKREDARAFWRRLFSLDLNDSFEEA